MQRLIHRRVLSSRIILAVLLVWHSTMGFAVPVLPIVPLVLGQVLGYLHPNEQPVVYPDTPRVKRLLHNHQSFICHTKIMVTTPNTVAFYREKNQFKQYLGVTGVGKWLTNKQMCIDNQPVVAVTWDRNGKPHTFRTLKNYSNINQQLSVIYPKDFNAPTTNDTVLCRVSVLNNGASPMAFYAEKIASDRRLAILKPFEHRVFDAPCFKDKRILGVFAKQQQDKLTLYYFATTLAMNDINHLPYIEFPKQFKSVGEQHITLKPNLLQMLLAG